MIDIVIVNWNAGCQLRECLSSINTQAGNVISRLIVVDNGSTDGSADDIESTDKVEVIRTGENIGFGAACNIGARSCKSPYILFLNPDTRLEPDSLSVPLDFMDMPENSTVGICGIQLVDEYGAVGKTCSRFPTLGRLLSASLGLVQLPWFSRTGMKMREWNHMSTRQVDQVMGAFFLCRRSVFEMCDGFDERFFVYFEEVDIARRSQLAGWSTWYLAETRAYHAGGGTSRQVKARRLFYSLRSRLLYAFKHFPAWQAWLLLGATVVLEPFTRSAWCLMRADFPGIKHTWSAYAVLWRSLGHILRGDGRYNP